MGILLSRLLEPSSYDAGSGPGFCNKLEVCYSCGSTTAVTTRSEVTGKQVEQHTAHSTYEVNFNLQYGDRMLLATLASSKL